MTKQKTRGRQIHIEIPADEYDAFKALAKEQERTLQGLARLAIRAYIEGVTAIRSEFKAPADEEQNKKQQPIEATNYIVQVNGKVRGAFNALETTPKSDIEQYALNDPNVIPYVEGKTTKKIAIVPGREYDLINIVV
ncbi:hypothetical protein ABEG10_21590 [Burkholderia cenocepacia]|uniref:hypothetical protein n=1 Tax=Burkholderia cenocepacia TaxID=95486 RepID=UPI0020A02FA2|nr:hypothetical protein [Burkholderia cenocepacia]MCO8320803.1 hypothetical protein [Burkholderia cenocepacia]MCO8328087.1 hypothetical protein [Burkholderia cenocepacia]MCO8335374.1 hypothetical protein [Burkholderia cenocepacia]MCO8342658.1 hypothetical protein [Burkholderia cenocepacia]MCO8355940.1 hypothetical protein [Burkholderia cenocepacia]